MAGKGAAVTVEVVAEVKKLQDGIGQVNQSLASVEKAAKSSGGVLKGMLGASVIQEGVGMLTSALGDAWESAQKAELVGKQTEAVLKSTGGAARVSANDVNKLATSIRDNSMISAGAVKQGENLLLTFTNVQNRAGAGNDIFNQATQAMADMGTAMGLDMPAAAQQLGKALNDPVDGMSKLARVGVTFTDEQRKAADQMMKTGDIAGAQKIILDELGKEFGGSAAASADTFAGAMFKVGNQIKGVLAGEMKNIMPIVKEAAQWLGENLPKGLDVVKTGLGYVGGALASVGPLFSGVFKWMSDNPETMTAFAVTLGVLGTAFGIVALATAAWNAILAINPVTLVVLGLAALVAAIVWVTTHIGQIGAFMAGTWNSIWTGAVDAWNGVTSAISGGVSAGVEWVKSLPARAVAALASFGAMIGGAATAGWAYLTRAISTGTDDAVKWVTGLPGRLVSGLGDLGTLLYNQGAKILAGFFDGLKSGWDAVTGWVGGIATWISEHKGPLDYDARLLTPHGKAIMQGLLRGLTSERGHLNDLLASITGQIDGGLAANPTVHLGVAGAYDTSPTPIIVNLSVQVDPAADRASVGKAILEALEALGAQLGRKIAWVPA